MMGGGDGSGEAQAGHMKHHSNAIAGVGALLAFALFLAGCDHPYIKELKDKFGWTEARMVSDGWLKSRPIPPEQVYCYETIGVADCYAHPNAQQRDQRITDRRTSK